MKEKYGTKCKTGTNNIAILELYEFILKNENSDTDYWCGGGTDDLNYILKDYFTKFDWKELEIDLPLWSNEQLEIFLYSIMNGYSYNLSQDKIFENNPKLIKKLTQIVPNKTSLILPILRIGIKRGISNDIILIAKEEMFFILNHFEVLIHNDKEYLNKINEIIKIIGTDFIEYPELKEKIKKASR